uniref:Putative transglutaminase domain-containing protein n=1 Tax=viral metagenome TaxID=1070528 RepID=A0A6M3L6V4_9ZZZZ
MKKLLFILLITFLASCIPHIDYTPYMAGDCVDRAVKIRQDLKQGGYEVELVLGLDGEKRGHCWVKYKDKETGEWVEIKN